MKFNGNSHVAKKSKRLLYDALVAMEIYSLLLKVNGCYEVTGFYRSQWLLWKANSLY
jgi:hypothetical protein